MSAFLDDRRPWLANARAQSAQLAASRARNVPPFRGALPLRPTRPLLRVARVATMIVIAMMALASGAWALVTRLAAVKQTRLDVASDDVTPQTTGRVFVPAVSIPRAQPIGVIPRRAPMSPTVTLAKPTGALFPQGPVKFEEGDADFILVPPRPVQPPLFDPREYKERGLAP